MAFNFFAFMHGKRPKVPELKDVSPEDVQAQTIEGNLKSLPGAEELASGINQFSTEQLMKALEFRLPGQFQQASQNVSNQLQGIMAPEDTKALISNATAAGYGRGFGPSFGSNLGIGRNLVLRDLGLGVQQTKQQGLQNFLSLSRATEAPQFDFKSMFYDAPTRLRFEQQKAEDLFNREWLASQIEAAPNPAGAFASQLILTVAGSAGKAIAAGCWVARECYDGDPRWMLFRQWLWTQAPRWFFWLYMTFGRIVARMIRPFPKIKAMIRRWMDSKIEGGT